MREDLSLEELSVFGIRPDDELCHAVDPDDASWNESIFYDWFDAEGRVAGHLRVGRIPGQARCWFWLFLHQGGAWVAIEEPRLPLVAMHGDGFAYDGFGLSFERSVPDPLRVNRVRASGFGRVLSGPSAGRLVPVSVDIEVTAVGPAHSVGDRDVSGHTSEQYESNRFEQPTRVRGTQSVGDEVAVVDGRGERDHSWGPRHWNMEWTFLVVSAERHRFQCVHVQFDEDTFIDIGYLSYATTQNIEEVGFELRYDDARVEAAFGGTLRARAEDGTVIAGRIECVTAAEIDASHVFSPPQASVYRRGLIRFFPDDGGPPALGWLESNRFPLGMRMEEP